MKEAKDTQNTAGTTAGAPGNRIATRQAEATSSETLSDLEATENPSVLESDSTGEGQPSSTVSPDGPPEANRSGRTRGSDKGGPM